MTFTEIQNNVAGRLNLTSTVALARIGESINIAHRSVCSSIGMELTQRAQVSAPTVMNNRFLTLSASNTTPSVGVEKVLAISNPNFTPPLVLMEAEYDELFQEIPSTDPPQQWAVFTSTANTVTVFFDSTISTSFNMTYVVLANMSTLSGTQTPLFAEDFHDILELAAERVELRKMEKYDMANDVAAEMEDRKSQLRFYYAKSAFKDIVQGKLAEENILRTVPLV